MRVVRNTVQRSQPPGRDVGDCSRMCLPTRGFAPSIRPPFNLRPPSFHPPSSLLLSSIALLPPSFRPPPALLSSLSFRPAFLPSQFLLWDSPIRSFAPSLPCPAPHLGLRLEQHQLSIERGRGFTLRRVLVLLGTAQHGRLRLQVEPPSQQQQ
eukprot:61908-Chlamydomonas_euryale.AAC.2